MWRTIFILLFFNFSQHVFSIEKAKKDTVSINEVYVTRVRPAERDISAASLQSISGKELELVSGNTAADAIKNFSGIAIKDYGGIGGFKTVMVRSLGANHTGVFIDGVQFSDAATGQIDLGKISIENAEGVSLYLGQPSAILQPARMFASASVLNIKSTNVSKNLKPISLKANLKTGSFGLINPSINVQNKWSDRFFSDLSFSYSKANGIYPFKIKNGTNSEFVEHRNNSDIESMNLNANLMVMLRDSADVAFKVYYYNSKRGMPGAVVFYNQFASQQQLWNHDFFVNFKFEKKSINKFRWLSNAKISQNSLRYVDPIYLNTSGIIDNRYTQHEYYVSQAVSYPFLNHIIVSLASDFIINKLKTNLPTYSNPTRYTSLTAFSLNWNFSHIEANANLLSNLVREKTLQGAAAASRNILSPTFGLTYLLLKNPSLRLRFLYKDIFRMPTFNDLYYTQIGNIHLNPEWAKQYSIGFSSYTAIGFLDYISLKAEFYQNVVKDKIIAIPTKNLFIWSMRNIGKVDIKGFETNIRLQTKPILNCHYSLSLNYSYQQALDMSDRTSSTYKHQIPYIPFESFSSVANIGFKSVNISWNSIFNGYRYVLSENIYDNMLSSWWIHDIALIYKLDVKSISMKIKGELNNVFDAQYEVIRSFPMPGRSLMFSLILNY